MNDPFYLFFRLGPALQALFQLDYLPTEEDFKELTDSQYQKYMKEFGKTEDKIYMLLPEDPIVYARLDTANEGVGMVVSDSEKSDILNAVSYIENLSKECQWQLTTIKAKLSFAAKSLPDVFTKGTSYETFHKNKTYIIE